MKTIRQNRGCPWDEDEDEDENELLAYILFRFYIRSNLRYSGYSFRS